MEASKNIDVTFEDKPTVSVIIPTFNRAHLLPRAISSILAQTFSDFELIIVDDGSTDNTTEVVNNFIDPRIQFIPLGKNCGGSHARNQGIKAARADLVAFLDSDDEWMPEKLELQINRLQTCNDPNATVVYCSGYESISERQKLPSLPIHEGDVFDHLLRGWLPPTTSLFMVKRSALLSVGGFDESLPSFQDYDLWLSLAAANNHFIAVNKPLIIRYYHNEQVGGNLSAKITGFNIFKEKWGTIMKQRVGVQAYNKFIGVKTSLIQLVRSGKAIEQGHKISAIREIFVLSKFLPWSGEFMLKGLMLIVVGHQGYKYIFQAKNAIYNLVFQKPSNIDFADK